MQFPSALAFITLLVSFPLAMHAQNLPNDYFIKKAKDPSKTYLQVFSADGKVAFTFDKTINSPAPFENTVTITDPSLLKFFSLVSIDDQCGYKTQYTQIDGPNAKDGLRRRDYKFDNSPVFGKKLWRFNFYSNAAGSRMYYKFIKNKTNAGGKIYKVAADQLRKDKWMNSANGEGTYTLSCIDGAPLPELVAMLGLAFLQC
ncbi:uncharacterized protein PGTG_05793 [Puccinia graminis f. sp. tritici CRL 75-36-700-3]|uniref:Secreted protein n=1 Tax=Puccinia graminis f. sp. tritici (strain CRL 75-36-700-3 / race SCCL) TaxID=418459 RepID=E3K5L5_PUCGT|nr:uncharacterized protein PGTG_05793 [Puccinia graminis f. sp. tritici CRL 75-36-700-3]EFP79472.1 hypothetical protein PGTG_05793 [Puccinia graminis f. sp. tritici CRL 75-36-700-3]